MAQSSGFFDAEELVDGGFDREYVAEQWANYFKLFIGNGVFSSPTNQLKVIAYSGMHVKLSVGWAFINGYWYHNDAELDLEIPVNVTASTRTDGIFIQWDSADRTIRAVVGEGRTEVDRISPHYELKVAEIFVDIGATAITDANITDTRADSAVCGFVTGVIDVIDSTNLFAQFTSIFEEWFEAMREQAIVDKEDWDAWYAALQEELHNLPPESAEYLQVQIDELKESGLSGSIINISTVNESLQGRTVTITSADGQEARTGEFDSNLKCTINGFKSVGTATLTATDGLQTATASLTIQYFSNYTVALAFWAATVNIHTTDSALFDKTITITRDGVTVGTTSFDSEGEAVYTATEAGNYTFTCEGNSASVNVTEETTYNVSISGAGLSLASWLTAGSTTEHPINPSSYSTFADVEADEEVVRQLMTVHAAVDYLATSDGTDELIGQVINSDICAKWINLRDYALDTLSANPVIKELMDESDKKIEPLVPIMTSNTTPSGECIGSADTVSETPAWYAFNGNSSNNWASPNVNSYVGYKFTHPVCVKELLMTSSRFKTGAFEASNDGVDWVQIGETFNIATTDSTTTVSKTFDNSNSYQYYRVRCVTRTSSNPVAVRILQFYGEVTHSKYGYGEWALMPQVPKMTSNTAPYGVASSSSNHTNYSAYQGFADSSTFWASALNAVTNEWLQYQFVSSVKAVRATFTFRANEIKDYKIQASNDGSTWTDLTDILTAQQYSGESPLQVVNFTKNIGSYTRYRLYVLNTYSGASHVTARTLQFYAWQPKGNVPVMTSNTAPYGTAFRSTMYAQGSPEAYKAFDGESGTGHAYQSSSTEATTAILGYHFVNPVKVAKLYVFAVNETGSYGNMAYSFTVQGSNDGTNYTDLVSVQSADEHKHIDIPENKQDYYLYYRLYDIRHQNSYSSIPMQFCQVQELQFYGRELSVSVPTMTSNTAPWGEVLSSTPYTDMEGYKAFNKVTTDSWGNASSSEYGYIGFRFPHPVKITRFDVFQRTIAGGSYNGATESFKLQASNDGNTWTDISELIENWICVVRSGAKNFAFDANSLQAYQYYRLYVSPATMDLFASLAELQFYGLDYSEREFAEGSTMKYIYDHGVELEEIRHEYIGSTESHVSGSYIDMGSDYIECYGDKVGIDTQNYIDITNYTLARAVSMDVFDSSVNLGVGVNHVGAGTLVAYTALGSNPHNPSLDISNVSGNNYVTIFWYSGNTTTVGTAKKFRIKELWLE